MVLPLSQDVSLLSSMYQSAFDSNEPPESLLARARRMDEDAWRVIFEQYYPRLYGFVYNRVNDPNVAEDLTNEVFERAVRSIHQFRSTDIESMGGWLKRIAQNLIYDYYRDQAHHQRVEPLEDHSLDDVMAWVADIEKSDPSRQLLTEESYHYLYLALDNLTDEQRDVVILRFIAQMRISEVAKRMGKSEGAIKALQFRALAALRRELRKLGYEERG